MTTPPLLVVRVGHLDFMVPSAHISPPAPSDISISSPECYMSHLRA